MHQAIEGQVAICDLPVHLLAQVLLNLTSLKDIASARSVSSSWHAAGLWWSDLQQRMAALQGMEFAAGF
ncbi:hypothetical protein WJX73_001289 [Symbiochloris irregularis]|uniref:F-box domain-containing protein n=1 Tax=Symbiochloris irregularis TaxID=706552 RepID=A0AAW1P013_9CHLO